MAVLSQPGKVKGGVKLTAPASQGRGHRGGAKFDPPSLTRFEDRFECIVKTLTSNSVLPLEADAFHNSLNYKQF